MSDLLITSELEAALDHADSGVLLAILVQLTGDTELLDRWAASVEHTADPPEMRGIADGATHRQIVDGILAVLAERRAEAQAPADPAPDHDVAWRLFELALGQKISADYVPMLLEQGGFERAQPTVAHSKALPADTTVAIVGAGLAGIAAALAAQRAGVAFEIYERNSDVGGTWLTQRYPGVGVDTPAAFYSLSMHLNTGWSSYYPKGGEFNDYLTGLYDDHAVRDHVHFDTEVEALRWDEEQTRWQITLRSGDRRWTTTATFVITAAGYFNRVKHPDWPGRESFAGLSVHSGQWDTDIDLAGKRVAVVGTGCTSAQIVDVLSKQVEHLTLVQRQPHWVAPRKRASDDISEPDRILLRELPLYAQWRRVKAFWGAADNGYPVVVVDPEWARDHVSISPANDALMQECLSYIDRTFGAGSELAQKMTPDFAPFGKRIIRDPGGYYDALTRPHVSVESAAIQQVVPEGIINADGELIELDAIIYATGYTMEFLSDIEIRGRGGITLAEEWDGNPRAYIGGTIPGFPNFFMTSAPNQLPSHGAGNNFSIEVAVHYAFECIQLIAERGARTIEPTRAAYDSFVREIDDTMEGMVWRHTVNANSYYRDESGRVIVACPFRLLDAWRLHRSPIEENVILSG